MKRILALDLTLTGAGVAWCIRESAGQPVFETETVSVPSLRVPSVRPGKLKNAPRVGAARLHWWRDWFVGWLCQDPDVVAVEDLAYHAPNACHVAKLYGVLELLCFERDVPLIYVNIKTIKLHATGMGDCDKQRMIDTAVERFGVQVRGEHEADAAWLCDYVYRKEAL